jgi:phosphonate transport system substrate-binding protein
MVRSSSPYRTLADLKGKKIAFVDFNSTSGYIFPRRAMRNQGIDPDNFFGDAIMAGGATQAAMALVNGRVDAAMILASAGTPETGFAAGSHISLARKGL